MQTFFLFFLSFLLPSLLPLNLFLFFYCFSFEDGQVYNSQELANQNNEMTTFWVTKLLWILVEAVWVATVHFTPLLSQLSSHPSSFFMNFFRYQYPMLVIHYRRSLGKLEISHPLPNPPPPSNLPHPLLLFLYQQDSTSRAAYLHFQPFWVMASNPLPQFLGKLDFEESCPCNFSPEKVNMGIKQWLLSYVEKFTWVHEIEEGGLADKPSKPTRPVETICITLLE